MLRRSRRNVICFIISYVINNLASGVLYDTYVNYLQDVQTSIATSFWSFYGYATFIAAAILLLVPKTGYKKVIIFCTASTSLAFFSAVFIDSAFILYVSTLLALTGVQLHFVLLAPFIASYSKEFGSKDINWYTRAYYMGYIGYFFATYLGGLFVVKAFSLVANIDFSSARALTSYIEDMPQEMHALFLSGTKDVLLAVGVISLLSLIPNLLIKEEKEDYVSIRDGEQTIPLKEKVKESIKLLFKKETRAYLSYWAIVSFAMGLFTSYYTIYLNRVLHIDKVTSSLLVSISYIAIVVFMFLTPFTVKKIGKKGAIVFTMAASIPFMLLIANGDKFGRAMIFVVGASLFVRAGLANLAAPCDPALSMELVDKDLRPIYNSLINFVAGIVSILSGMFTGNILFVNEEGYRWAYYIAAVLYIFAILCLVFGIKEKKVD